MTPLPTSWRFSLILHSYVLLIFQVVSFLLVSPPNSAYPTCLPHVTRHKAIQVIPVSSAQTVASTSHRLEPGSILGAVRVRFVEKTGCGASCCSSQYSRFSLPSYMLIKLRSNNAIRSSYLKQTVTLRMEASHCSETSQKYTRWRKKQITIIAAIPAT
jgi:hypothetical protein